MSIIIEALPFILLGAILSGFIEVFLTPELVQKHLPKRKLPRILFGTFVGFVFPSCKCGIVPIINRFLEKKVPSYTAVPFLATAPIINQTLKQTLPVLHVTSFRETSKPDTPYVYRVF